ncbi:MAG: N-acetyl-gamma-glutamyl-phosphate reductase [Propionibacteriaceae bacterium]|jgi:N-acetyl-gamma-glutamyl-phosphate reductase|nr:N-acetyl-gamma-glutamyl-phosphate reductase [Propionibacteriaceae bacterium]
MHMKLRVAVAGCTGYAGGEAVRLLAGHPAVEIGALTAHGNAGARWGDLRSHCPPLADRVVLETTPENLAGHDVVVLALPHGASAALAQCLAPETLVLDLGADFRLSQPDDWAEFYDGPHAGVWPYGLPELPGQRAVLARSRRIAQPGCYPTATLLALAPVLAQGLSDGHDVVVVAASGASGAGKSPKPNLLGAELMGSVSAYGVGGRHRHIPEILQGMRQLGARRGSLSFTPLLAPMPRGILATCAIPVTDLTGPEAHELYHRFYADEPFVQVLPAGQWPMTASVLGSNNVQLQVTVDRRAGRLVAVAAIDNLTKGTAGGAVQCLNIACGLDEALGLSKIGVAP